ncbi:MAG: hypothetical protein AAGH19_09135 [Pseudomonadota bacterium]
MASPPKTPLLSLALTVLLGLPLTGAAAEAPDPETWFVETYGGLWLEAPWDQAEAIMSHYTEQVISREPGAAPETVPTREWIGPLFGQWRDEGWLSAEVVAIQTDRLNANTAVFKARWKDVYTDGSEAFSCGWYLADLVDGAWKNSEYTSIDCADHGLD